MLIFRYSFRSFAREIAFIAGAIVFCIPLYVLLALSLKSTTDVYSKPLTFPADPHAANYSDAWTDGGQTGLGGSFVSSAIITGASVACIVVLGSLCAYVIARRRTRVSGGLYMLFVAGLIVPFQLGIIPLYVAFRNLGLTGSYIGMILLYTGLLMPLSVFLYTGFIRAIPKEYEEAARVDGASLLRTYTRVVFPLLAPISATVAVLAGIFIWNDFFVALIFLFGSDKATLPLAVYSFVGEFVSQWNLIMAAVAISIAPILVFYLFAQRHLIRGFAGGIRG